MKKLSILFTSLFWTLSGHATVEYQNDQTLFIGFTHGVELSRILSHVPPHILVGLDGVTTDLRSESGIFGDNDMPAYWYQGKGRKEPVNLAQARLMDGVSFGKLHDGSYYIRSMSVMSHTTFAQAIHDGLKSTKSDLFSCEDYEVGRAGSYPGFELILCIIKP